jgi:hypothetical protein
MNKDQKKKRADGWIKNNSQGLTYLKARPRLPPLFPRPPELPAPFVCIIIITTVGVLLPLLQPPLRRNIVRARAKLGSPAGVTTVASPGITAPTASSGITRTSTLWSTSSPSLSGH